MKEMFIQFLASFSNAKEFVYFATLTSYDKIEEKSKIRGEENWKQLGNKTMKEKG